MVDWLRPKPHRGDVLAAGAVVLATLVALVDVRFDARGSDAVLLAWAGLATAFVGALALLSPREGRAPRAYQSVLYVATLALALMALRRLAPVLGADGPGSPGAVAWIAALLALAAWRLAATRNSATCTLLGAIASTVAVLAALRWASGEDVVEPSRWLALALSGVFVLAAVVQRDRRPLHAVALADAAGLAAALLAASFVGEDGIGDGRSPRPGSAAGWGWELFLFAAAFGLIAYGAVERQRGPAYLGALTLVLTVIAAGEPASLLGWPLVLALGAGTLLVVGLRPSRPLPPEPGGPPSDVIVLQPRP